MVSGVDPDRLLTRLDDFSRAFAAPLFAEFPELIPRARVENGVLEMDFHPGEYREDVRAFLSTDYQEITLGLGKWHTHFDWPPSPTEQPHWGDPLAALRGILADELRAEVRMLDGKWTRSQLLDPGETVDIDSLQPGEEVFVLSWSGRHDEVHRGPAKG